MRVEVLALVALLGFACSAEPPAPRPVQSFESNGGRYRVEVEPPLSSCRLGEPCSFEVRVERSDSAAPPPALRLEVDADMPDHRHGLNARPLVEGTALGGWRVEGLLLHMPGHWEVHFDLTEGAVTERAQAALER